VTSNSRIPADRCTAKTPEITARLHATTFRDLSDDAYICRHDGVVVEPVDGSIEEENSGSRSPSSSTGKEKSVETLPVQMTQGNPTLPGPSSYYRSHTANISRAYRVVGAHHLS
jgi:hypothetical protein